MTASTLRAALPALCLTAICLAGLSACGGPDTLIHEPAPGMLGNNEVVLVDDGHCPAGQVDRVTGPASLTTARTYACVPKR